MNQRLRKKGFTLIEVMIAVAIFAFLMLYVSQFMRQETKALTQATKQNELMQKARVAMVQVIDETRIPSGSSLPFTYDTATRKLWFVRDPDPDILIADDIYVFNITNVTDHLLRIEIVAGDPNTMESYKLLSWARIY